MHGRPWTNGMVLCRRRRRRRRLLRSLICCRCRCLFRRLLRCRHCPFGCILGRRLFLVCRLIRCPLGRRTPFLQQLHLIQERTFRNLLVHLGDLPFRNLLLLHLIREPTDLAFKNLGSIRLQQLRRPRVFLVHRRTCLRGRRAVSRRRATPKRLSVKEGAGRVLPRGPLKRLLQVPAVKSQTRAEKLSKVSALVYSQ